MTATNETGPGDELTINGTTLLLPRVLEPHNVLVQALSPTSGRPKLDTWRYGDGLPNVPDLYEWALDYQIDDDTYAETGAFLERLRTKGGVHLFTDWKARRYTYTARTAQQLFFLPRQDAFSLGYEGHDEETAIVTLNDEALTVLYKPTVTDESDVPEGECWISEAAEVHGEAGFTVAAFKVGTVTELYDDILVEFHALYRVVVTGSPISAWEEVGLESRALYLAEVA